MDGVFTSYIRAAMKRAKYEILEDGTFYGSIPGFQGVWSDMDTLEECREELQEVLEDWMLFRLSKGLALPEVEGVQLAFRETV